MSRKSQMTVIHTLFAAFVIVAGGVTTATAAAPAYPRAILAELKPLADQCREVTGKPGSPGSAVRKIDINGDGRTDYLFFQGDYVCDDAASRLAPGATYGVPTMLFLG